MKRGENWDNSDKTAYWWPTDDPKSWSNLKNALAAGRSGQVEIPDKAYFFRCGQF